MAKRARKIPQVARSLRHYRQAVYRTYPLFVGLVLYFDTVASLESGRRIGLHQLERPDSPIGQYQRVRLAIKSAHVSAAYVWRSLHSWSGRDNIDLLYRRYAVFTRLIRDPSTSTGSHSDSASFSICIYCRHSQYAADIIPVPAQGQRTHIRQINHRWFVDESELWHVSAFNRTVLRSAVPPGCHPPNSWTKSTKATGPYTAFTRRFRHFRWWHGRCLAICTEPFFEPQTEAP
jgi:hypothetical protein